MKRDRENDAAIGRMLRAGLRAPAAEVGACPQASDLAAFVEDALSKAEREAIERHAAACPRCQHSLALIGSMAPSTSAMPARSAWLPAVWLRWAIPVTVVATGVLLYVAVGPMIRPQGPATVTRPTSTTPVAQKPLGDRSLFAETVPAPVAPPATPGLQAPSVGSGLQAGTTSAKREARAEAPRARAKVPTAAPVLAPRLDALEERVAVVPQAAARQALAQQTPGQQVQAQRAQAQAAPLQQRNTLDFVTALPAGRAGVAGGIAGGVAGGVVGGPPEAPPPAPLKTAAGGQIGPVAERVQVAAASKTGKPTPTIIAAPGGSVRWRLDATGAVSRSRDGGVTWTPLADASSGLLAGSAPTSSVCWLVGRGGVILLTVDGERWEQRPFPERIDFVRVDARDARNATVTARDGRRFVTDDGGITWRQGKS